MIWGSRFFAAIGVAAVAWCGVGVAEWAIATPAKVFQPHLKQIQQQLPRGFAIRLPTRILLGGPADDEFIDNLVVKIGTTSSSEEVTIALLSCNDDWKRCWIGQFSVASRHSARARREYYRHLNAGTPIQLSQEVRAYVRDNLHQFPAITASSVMWEQNGLLYAAKFASPERQNMLYMALSMVNGEPIYASDSRLGAPAVQSAK